MRWFAAFAVAGAVSARCAGWAFESAALSVMAGALAAGGAFWIVARSTGLRVGKGTLSLLCAVVLVGAAVGLRHRFTFVELDALVRAEPNHGQPSGAGGYIGIAFAALCASVLTLSVPWHLLNVPYCERCKRYRSVSKRETLAWNEEARVSVAEMMKAAASGQEPPAARAQRKGKDWVVVSVTRCGTCGASSVRAERFHREGKGRHRYLHSEQVLGG